jgi:hypothetical protein
MRFLENTFLYRLFRADKFLFIAVLFYGAGIAYYALKQREEFPFLLYGMYSLKEKPQAVYTTYTLEGGGQEIKYAKLRDARRELISSTLSNSLPLIDSGVIDQQKANQYKQWLMNYCFDVRMTGENVMSVYRLTCDYDNEGHVRVLNKQKEYSYAPE